MAESSPQVAPAVGRPSSSSAAAAAQPGKRIVVFGSLNVDLTFYVPHHPEPGETLTSTRHVVRTGGKGANQAVACAKLSRRRPAGEAEDLANGDGAGHAAVSVHMVGAVGGDDHGALLKRTLYRYGVVTDGIVVREGQKTGVAIIMVDEDAQGENRIVLSPQANHSFAGGEQDPVLDAIVALRPDLLILQLEIPFPVVLAAIRRAKAAGIPVIFNPAPAQPLPDDVYAGLDHRIVNETEAHLLSGVDVSKSVSATMEAAAWFVAKGVRNVVITCGRRGAYCHGHDALGGAIQNWVRGRQVPAERVVDTTGAGDTFVGAYALSLLDLSPDVILATDDACYAASSSVEREGAQEGMPWKDDWEELLRERALAQHE